MAVEGTGKILEGVFAIHKPPHLSSAQVLRDLQSHFTPSKLFAPLLESERRKRPNVDPRQQQRRSRNSNDGQVKMGHGGTLDPLATGILIIGVGKGTKELPSFLGCTKTYDTVVLFGKSTDTYDVAGKVVASAPYGHVTKELVEEKLSKFRGKIQQAPPIYSAIKIDGKKAYDYARTGEELPRELAPRDMEVTECKMVEWHEGGTHAYRWPAEEAPEEEKEAARKLMQDTKIPEAVQDHSRKRKTRLVDEEKSEPEAKRPKTESDLPDRSSTSKKTAPENSTETVTADLVTAASSRHIHAPPLPSSTTSPAPACNISLTVSSGFYVRSFAHDLGLASHSLGIMASLVRSRQGDFSLDASPTPSTSSTSDSAHPASATAAPYGVLSYTELALGEEHWGPIVTAMLERWNSDHPPESDYDRSKPRRIDDRDRYPRNRDGDGREGGRRHDNPKGFSAKRGFGSGPRGRDSGQRRDRVQDHHASERRWERRNTSSGEE